MLCVRDGEPLTREPLTGWRTTADFSDSLAVSKTVGKNGNDYVVKKSLPACVVALKTFYLLFTPISLFAERWEFTR